MVAWWLVAALLCGPPPVRARGVHPGTVLPYYIVHSEARVHACVARAFTAWTTALATATQVQFVPAAPGQSVAVPVVFRSLPWPLAGSTLDTVRDGDGAVQGFGIVLSTQRAVLSTCDAYTKVTLHEIGHGLGLGDADAAPGRSVMAMLGGPDDRWHQVAASPTLCDIAQVTRAAH